MKRSIQTKSRSHRIQIRKEFDRRFLPQPLAYYTREIGHWRVSGEQLSGLCPFHDDKDPSFSASLKTGAFICFSCDTRGRDVIDFHRRRYGVSFIEAAKTLGAWR